MAEKDVENGRPTRIPFLRQVFDQAGITPEVQKCEYDGSGTEDDPYVVYWIDDDPRNPMLYSSVRKWSITMLVAIATLAVAFVSSAYSGGATQIIEEFKCSEEIFTLGISLFVLGFAIGKLNPKPGYDEVEIPQERKNRSFREVSPGERPWDRS